MEDPVTKQYFLSALCIVTGLLGWLLPYRWNILRFRRILASLLPEAVNLMIPKMMGTFLIFAGIVILIGTVVYGKLG